MPVPSPRNKILPARGNYSDLAANVAAIADGEICYAIDQDQYYQNEGGTLVAVGATKAQGALADTATQPGDNISTLTNDAGYITSAALPGTTDDLTEGATNLYSQWDTVTGGINYAGGNVGIGTSTPTEKLDVVGIAKATSGYFFGNTSSYLYEGAADQVNIRVGSDGPYVEFIDAGGSVLELGNGSGQLALTSSGTERLRIDSSGRVGINKTAPYGMLNVYAAENTATFVAEGEVDNPGYPSYGFAGQNLDNGTRGAGMYLPADSTLAFSTAAEERLRIDSSGNVGIGTSSPFYRLHVSGTGVDLGRIESTDNSNVFLLFKGSTTTQSPQVGAIGDNAVFRTAFTERMRISSAGNVGIGTSSPGAKLQVENTGSDANLIINRADATTAGNLNISSGDGVNYIYSGGSKDLTIATNNQERIRINAAGDVGIGTSSPGAKLDVEGDSIFAAADDLGTVNIVSTSNSIDSGNKIAFFGANRTNANEEMAYIKPLLFSNSGGAGNVQTGHLTFGTSGSERLRIDPTGNVGIGTTNPQRTFSVSSTEGVVGRLESTGARARLGLKDVNTTTDSHVGIGSAGDNFLIYAGQAEKVRVTSSGDVGIGTSSPDALLHVQQSADGEIFRVQRTGGTNLPILRFNLTEATPDAEIEQTGAAAGAIGFKTGATRRMTIASNGNVGIGTSSPGYALDVLGGASDTYLRVRAGSTNSHLAGLLFGDSSSGAPCQISYNNISDSLQFTVNGGERLRIDSSGNVGIGTSSPGVKLEVNGTIKATDINFTGLATYADDSAAGTGGLVAGDVYKTSTGELRIKL